MIPVVMNTSFERLGMIDDYTSFIWTERYYKVGDFELCVAVSPENLAMLQRDYYVCRDDSEDVGIIEDIKLSSNADGEQQMIVSGRFLASIVGRRIVAQQTEFNDKTIPAIIQGLLNDAIISPSIEARKIPNFSFQDDSGYTGTLSIQYTGKNLLETIEYLCKTYGLGFKVVLESGNFVFHLYSGTDRSYGQTENTFVVFSNDYDNLKSSEYEEGYSDTVTDVLVAGEGEGLERKMAWASKQTNAGLARYEAFKDARNASTNDGEISDSVYLQQLVSDGLESITSFTKAFSGSVYFNNYTYGKDIKMGDVCTIMNTRWGIGMNTRIIEMIESTSESGEHTMTPTFGV